MKANQSGEGRAGAGDGITFSGRCARGCRKILAQLRRVKFAIDAEARGTLAAHERLLELALSEAEALAWQTAYPHLVFPVLATEKVQAVADWDRHQRSIRRTD